MIDRHTAGQYIIRAYGFDLPDDFYRFAGFCEQLSEQFADKETEDWVDGANQVLLNTIGVSLRKAFDVFRPDFDPDLYNPPVNDRFLYDPPEFLTMLDGGSIFDGQHWGYWFDGLDRPSRVGHCDYECCIEFYDDGFSLFTALNNHINHMLNDDSIIRNRLEDESAKKRWQELADTVSGLSMDEEKPIEKSRLEMIHKIQGLLKNYLPAPPEPERLIFVPCVHGLYDDLGVYIEKKFYRKPWHPLYTKLVETNDADIPKTTSLKRLVKETLTLADSGFPGAAYALGRRLWIMDDPSYWDLSEVLLKKALPLLHRSELLPFLDAALSYRRWVQAESEERAKTRAANEEHNINKK